MAKTKIYFLTTIKQLIWNNKRVYFTYEQINLSGEFSKYIKTKRIKEKEGFYINFNEFDVENNLLIKEEEEEDEEENEEIEEDEENIKNLKIYLSISKCIDEDPN